MKKVTLFALALIVSLPGCCKKQKKSEQNKKPRVEQSIDMFSSVDMVDAFAPDELDEDNDNLRTFFDFDEEAEEFIPGEDANIYRNFDLEDEAAENQSYTWVDEQSQDELKNLYFAFNKYGLSEDQKKNLAHDIEQLQQLVADAGSDAQPLIVVEGHTDEEGSPAYNLGLSENRAKTVANLLVAAGFDQENIKIVGRGQEMLAITDGKTREDRAPNRRVELRVIYT